MVLDGKSSQEYLLNARVSQGSIRGPALFLLCINELPEDVICDIGDYGYLICLWQQLELASELESGLWETGQGQKVACQFQCWKISSSFV